MQLLLLLFIVVLARYYIRVKPGVYKEYLKVPINKTNIALFSDDAPTTKITGDHSHGIGFSTEDSSTMKVEGSGFMAQSITIENSAPPPKSGQAVALSNSSNHSAFYKCVFLGYQDTLLAYHNLQFYKDCDIYGTVDFIFGFAKVVFQDCCLYARRIGDNYVTAQGKDSPALESGFSFQNCTVMVAPELEARKHEVAVTLGRSWRVYTTVVFMQSYLDDIVNPEGWTKWGEDITDLFYAKYANSGSGANTSERVKWPGYKVFKSAAEAIPFTVSKYKELMEIPGYRKWAYHIKVV